MYKKTVGKFKKIEIDNPHRFKVLPTVGTLWPEGSHQ